MSGVFFSPFFIEIKLTYHKIHHFHNSVVFNMFTEFCSHGHYLTPEHFSLPQKETSNSFPPPSGP